MADQKISQLGAAGALTGQEVVPVVQSAATVRTTTAQIAALATPGSTPTIHYSIVSSGTRPATPTAGDMIYETDTKKVRVWDGAAWRQTNTLGAWDTYTPTISGGAGTALGNGVISGRWTLVGRICHFRIQLVRGTSTVLNAAVKFSLPATRAGGASIRDVFPTTLTNRTGSVVAVGQTISSDNALTTRTLFATDSTGGLDFSFWGDLDDTPASNVPFNAPHDGEALVIAGTYETT